MAAGGIECISLSKQIKFDIIFMDNYMPDMVSILVGHERVLIYYFFIRNSTKFITA